MKGLSDPQSVLKLSPVKAAKVSEISEATASSSTAAEDKVNFHIGNPVEDGRLSSAYLRMVLGIGIQRRDLDENHLENLGNELGWALEDRKKLDLLARLIQKSAPYTPRGGFLKSKPIALVHIFHDWLVQGQKEPLFYDLGETSGQREVILAGGGREDALRILLHALAKHLIATPACVLFFRQECPRHWDIFPELRISATPQEEGEMVEAVMRQLAERSDRPVFLVIGSPLAEKARRALRQASLAHPLFFIEVNDSPNHLSLAREARLMNRVLRILTPGVLAPRLSQYPIVFLAGNAEYLEAVETMHFQLKGTPPASEIEMLTSLLEEDRTAESGGGPESFPPCDPSDTGLPTARLGRVFGDRMKSQAKALEAAIRDKTALVEAILDRVRRKEEVLARLARGSFRPPYDANSGRQANVLLDDFASRVDSEEWTEGLQQSFLQAFVRHHPEYRLENCLVVSGSARTAFGLFGFHCGIEEVVIPDLSWTYEHGFPRVSVVPLTEDLRLDGEGLMAAVAGKISSDPGWLDHGAVVLNNPHNATGRRFDEEALKSIILRLLQRGVRIIDDVSYQNVVPVESWPFMRTLRHLTDELLREGSITTDQSDRLLTVHSLSKTDCLAGARLAVAEIRERKLFDTFKDVSRTIRPNAAAILLAYLFYRNTNESVTAYWQLRNTIFKERMDAILEAVRDLPGERNRFSISVDAPQGSMYPQMVIRRLPPGLSLDWVASGLSRQGIGLIPLATFARTGKGYESARTSFRLTLGGSDGAEILRKKTRRVLIDLNRLIGEEAANYSRKRFVKRASNAPPRRRGSGDDPWKPIEEGILLACESRGIARIGLSKERSAGGSAGTDFRREYLPERLSQFRRRFEDGWLLAEERVREAASANGKNLLGRLENEYFKDSLDRRQSAFRHRTHDRTVHPTQMYSLRAEWLFETIMERLIGRAPVSPALISRLAEELKKEYLGLNVAIDSGEESEELILELASMIAAEDYAELFSGEPATTFLSFWGDWDGSSRPSGQGHRLVASVLMENVSRQARTIRLLKQLEPGLEVEAGLMAAIQGLPDANRRFAGLMNSITLLTHHLEKRFRGVLPVQIRPGLFRRVGMTLGFAQDPLLTLWEHNDRLERKMLELRSKRRRMLEDYFALNKRLRKTLKALLPDLRKHLHRPDVLRDAVGFHDLMKRFAITPRIHQNMITMQDPFAIDTTVHNIQEINEIGAMYGNPGMILALQVSMSTKPEALISLERKVQAGRERVLRENNGRDIPPLWIVPLFEDIESVKSIPACLNRIWEHALQCRRMHQDTRERFLETVSEVFIAGSDLSQHVGQAAGMMLYKRAKYEVACWLAERGLLGDVRVKLGSGEPMQRQGAYYTPVAGQPAFLRSEEASRRLSDHLRESTKKSTEYAVTPLLGIFSGGDLRTLQSNVSETMRSLPIEERAQVLHHLRESQRFYETEMARAGEPLLETRLKYRARGFQELERLTISLPDPLYEAFLSIHTENFRQIVYGREEDVVGLHLISYFIARTTPPLRDRPTVRPGKGMGGGAGRKILEKIAETIPFSKYGSLLRAIAHNQAQSAVLGVNQLTTGLFRALDQFATTKSSAGDAGEVIEDRVLPHLAVYDVLNSLRLYNQADGVFLNRLERAFPAGNSALLALREDADLQKKYLPLIQRELLRRHGLNVVEFFENGRFLPDLLPALRPDLAVLLQADLFNTDLDLFLSQIRMKPNATWTGEIARRLEIPARIQDSRRKIWELLENRVFPRVQSFAELAVALASLAARVPGQAETLAAKRKRLSSSVSNFFKMAPDDRLQSFLGAAMDYLSALSEGPFEVPINIIRAMKDVERIIEIEEQALSAGEQSLLRFHLLQISRLAGENG